MTSRLRIGVLLAIWVGLTGLLIAAGIGVVHSSAVTAFDRHVTSSVVANRTPALNVAMKVVTWFGSWVALVATAVVVVVLALRGRLVWLAVGLAVAAWAGEAAAVALAKQVVQRQRPPVETRLVSAHGWSWPSGHKATAVLVFAVLAMLVSLLFSSRVARVASWVGAIAAMGAVGFSRIELGVHWTTDVMASYVFVTIWLLVIVRLFRSGVRDEVSTRHE
jgi:undecaprenyl-diphosphatase